MVSDGTCLNRGSEKTFNVTRGLAEGTENQGVNVPYDHNGDAHFKLACVACGRLLAYCFPVLSARFGEIQQGINEPGELIDVSEMIRDEVLLVR